MKIYISLPITGHRVEDCKARADEMAAIVRSLGHEAVTPFDVCPEQGLKYATYIGRDIEALLQCDGIFLLSGWSGSAGCTIEWRAAEVFHKKVFHHLSQIREIGQKRRK